MHEHARILVIQTNRLGDSVLGIAGIQLIRSAHPAARLDVLHRGQPGSEFFDALPEVDRTMRWQPHSIHRGPAGRVRLCREVRRWRYDAAVAFYSSPAPLWAAFAAGIPMRIVRYVPDRDQRKVHRFLCNHLVHQDRDRCEHHEAEYNMHLLAPLGIAPVRRRPRLPVSEAARREVKMLLDASAIGARDRLAILHSGASKKRPRWPAANFAAVGDALTRCGARILLTGGPEDGDRPRLVAGAMEHAAVDLSGRLSIPQLAALMERASLFVGLDTGPMHVAAACGVPVAVLLPQRVQRETHSRWFPYGSDFIAVRGSETCNGCHTRPCPPRNREERIACHASLPAAPVIEAAAALFTGAPHPHLVRWKEGDSPSTTFSENSHAAAM